MSIFARFLAWLETQIFLQETTKTLMQPQGQPAPATPAPVPIAPTPEVLEWDTPVHAFHATRVLCDNAGLTVEEKNDICACIYQESRFNNNAVNRNRNSAGVVMSSDWGICQVNDYYHIGPNKDFPTVAYVVGNPGKAVAWMITMYQHGCLKQWVSYSSGAYRQWLEPGSPMWALHITPPTPVDNSTQAVQ